jgi:hypothetical protein
VIWPPCSGAMGQHASPLPLQHPARSPKSCIQLFALGGLPPCVKTSPHPHVRPLWDGCERDQGMPNLWVGW